MVSRQFALFSRQRSLFPRRHDRFHARAGFTLIEVMLVVLIIGVLLAIAVPNYVRARESSRQKACINNLKQIYAAKEQWAMDNRQPNGVTPQLTWLIGTYIQGPKYGSSSAESRAREFRCPSSGSFYGTTMGSVGNFPICPTASARTGPYAHVYP